MWIKGHGRLIHTTDASRVKFRTNISQSTLNQLNTLATRYDTYQNYLLESGLQTVLEQGVITFDKESRPNDRVQYKTTYDKDLLQKVMDFAKEQKLYVNDVLEYSVQYIDYNSLKNKGHKHRVEKL
ncbi:rRNA methyltransferase [Geomicrobium sediminis]|uniref:Hydroxymethylpyrimidine pyrophosphatase-like HAD family hydrolase n=1 Tax=Geomicrobium sediminis TaxID=1347788 RepID=A0ABS2PFT0_9BACL|nr:rRNA methyltransferase [Geomicrobium sediminis]MBM7634184.1 hydroxymethylpyrimidine pyrophosphatase-like HAD family hydrolase [Geomicrobium sediminis]